MAIDQGINVTSKAAAQAMLDGVREGRTSWSRTPEGVWMVIGPPNVITPGATVTVTKRDGGTSEVVIDQLGVRREVQGVEYQMATVRRDARSRRRVETEDERAMREGAEYEAREQAAEHAALSARPRRCRYHETDNNGICYSCGAYVRGDDVGAVIGRMFG